MVGAFSGTVAAVAVGPAAGAESATAKEAAATITKSVMVLCLPRGSPGVRWEGRPGGERFQPASTAGSMPVDHLGVVAAADHPPLAAGAGGRRGQVIHQLPVAVAAREAGEPLGLRQHAAAATAGTADAVGDGRVVAAAGHRSAAAANDVAAERGLGLGRAGGQGEGEEGGECEACHDGCLLPPLACGGESCPSVALWARR